MANMDLLSYERDSRWMPHLSWTHLDWTLQQRMEQQAAHREQAWQKIIDKLGPLLLADSSAFSFGQSDYISRDIEDQDYLDRVYEKAPLLGGGGGSSSGSSSGRQQNNFNQFSTLNNQSKLYSSQYHQHQSYSTSAYQTKSQSPIQRYADVDIEAQAQPSPKAHKKSSSSSSLAPSSSSPPPTTSYSPTPSSGTQRHKANHSRDQHQDQLKRYNCPHHQRHDKQVLAHDHHLERCKSQGLKEGRRRFWTISITLLIMIILILIACGVFFIL